MASQSFQDGELEEPFRVDGWELTWPIWHMLGISEKKDIAARRNMTIGEFEEYMSLQRATELSVEQGGEDGYSSHRYVSASLFTEEKSDEEGKGTEEEEEEVDDVARRKEEEYNAALEEGCADRPSREEMMNGHGGMVMQLPDEILYRLMSYIDVDSYGICGMVSPHWKFFTSSEMAFKLLCERCYLKQSKRKILNLERWLSYKNMFINRPRVRLNGVYVLKYRWVKRIQRDMWTEIPEGAILEQVYYRYLSFQENGTVFYALTAAPPYEMIPRFIKMKRFATADKQAVVGNYEVSKYNIKVWTSHKWSDISLELELLAKSPGSRSNFCEMKLVRHRLSPSGNFECDDVVEFDVPEKHFRFVRVWKL
mmetsp:Transcript_6141/g.8939  ORF Transcript_6141/g.8939 Transcript_6141/m.8939 type:complete len:367 (+) Transcript_6141:177-1277(+)|eukprot:CAMPEP_0196817240 /NCGR_PEP_ID=MMETSP1362-20130617/59581_1 /TAXON_ID=163516 /ORGANISM="Leptocylindrus danicus, Strain CCMP1856" /LENGTH=366 /DNA_ID=CAMNT_0042194863 /DNA_START=78 /DNA_END=1178 /DNA_ORIENTATION=+